MTALLDLPGVTYTRAGTATAWRADGTLAEFAANVPRITDLGVLVEGQRTNLFARWDPTAAQVAVGGTALNCSDAPAPANAPLSGRKWIALDNSDSTAAAWAACQSIPTSTVVICSLLVETPDGSQPVFGVNDAGVDFQLRSQNGADLTAPSAKYIRRSGNVWEVQVTGTTQASVPTTQFGPRRHQTANKRPLKFSGLQLEQASIASSPIITTGAAATRGADILSLAKTIAAGEDFTLLISVRHPASADGVQPQRYFQFDAGDNNNRLYMQRTGPSQAVEVGLMVGGEAVMTIPGPVVAGAAQVKGAVRRKGNTYTLALNGVIYLAKAPTVPPPNLTTLSIGQGRGASPLNATIQSLQIFPFAVSDAQLVSLTQ
ncbi:hypothetical protein HNP32_001306 [Brevundimonas bullata]|uniref:Concanavalin A-like lectin/glucanase superfamily protein n=1 Tax=Brevundimonas bullata TaxID=13160 RepID=A0A7W7N3V1_9CAUL|nr:hypothetical protein [Brevundimonas bullata]MBB4797582.1 hypothetical protein [Brevundimonas bullata]MBB6382542.1 hypothetical protein [Brevundimonas bullata]